jgi:hypothetical protein
MVHKHAWRIGSVSLAISSFLNLGLLLHPVHVFSLSATYLPSARRTFGLYGFAYAALVLLEAHGCYRLRLFSLSLSSHCFFCIFSPVLLLSALLQMFMTCMS